MDEKRKILIIEDEQITREVVSSTLEEAGYQVQVCPNGQEGLMTLLEKPKDFFVVLLDWMMPVMDGLTFLRELQKHQSVPDVPIIMVTSINYSESIIEVVKAGVFDYLIKPIDPADLLALIEKVQENSLV